MKFIGTIKPPDPINSFSIPILMREQNFFIQEIKNDRIIDFKPIAIERDEIIEVKQTTIKQKIGDDAFHCFLFDDDRLIYGTLKELRNELFPLLNKKKFNPIAKEIICSTYMMHGKRLDAINESNAFLRKKKISCHLTFETSSFQKVNINNNFTLIESILKESSKQAKQNRNIGQRDFIAYIGEETFIDSYSILINDFIEIIDSVLPKNDSVKLSNYLIECINNETVNRRILDKETIHSHFLTKDTNYSQFEFDRLLISSYNKFSMNKSKKSVMEIGFEIENRIKELKVKVEVNLKKAEELKVYALRIAQDLKRKMYEEK
jgi:hypothetical protein